MNGLELRSQRLPRNLTRDKAPAPSPNDFSTCKQSEPSVMRRFMNVYTKPRPCVFSR